MHRRAHDLLPLLLLAATIPLGCESAQRGATEAYYAHRYATARDRVRKPAHQRTSKNIVLHNLRLGLASLADGDRAEAESALLRAYEYLTSGGVNAPDRAAAATVLHEGVRVWTGEPYEQAMSFYSLSALYMLQGDWENARAAASNSLFSLRDFEGEPRGMAELARRSVRQDARGNENYLTDVSRRVESEFTLGYLLAATSYVLMGEPATGKRMFERVVELRPELKPLVERLRGGDFDTLLLVDQGRGPRKVAYGPDDALVRFVPDGREAPTPRVSVSVDGQRIEHVGRKPVVDLWTLSQFPKWWSLQHVRKAKSQIGTGLLAGGLGAAAIGSEAGSREAVYVGLAAALLGAATKASAEADTRHLAMLPRCVFLVPLNLEPGRHDVTLRFEDAAGSNGTWHELEPGGEGDPRVYYLRMHNAGGRGMPDWPDEPRYTLGVEQYRPGDTPWLTGGRDLTPPHERIVAAYHQAGVLENVSAAQLREAARGEGFVFRPGPQGRTGEAALEADLYHHAAEGGKVLWKPEPGTHLYERLTRNEHRAHQPRSEPLRTIIRTMEDRGPADDDGDGTGSHVARSPSAEPVPPSRAQPGAAVPHAAPRSARSQP